MKSHIIEEMLKKAVDAEAAGNTERAEHWLKRAEETEEKIKKWNTKKDGG